MTLVIAVAVLLAATLFYTLFVRVQDLPVPDPVSPTQHLDERKAAIYENLRDLQFEYRVGKLSDADYAQTKLSLQKELAVVLAETERITKGQPKPDTKPTPAVVTVAAKAEAPKTVTTPAKEVAPLDLDLALTCPHCGAEFPHPMRFCGACGKAMTESKTETA